MDEKKHLNILQECVGHGMNLELRTIYEPEQDASKWRGEGSIVFSATRDGINWGDVRLEVLTYDTTPALAISTLLGSAINFADSEDFLEVMSKAIHAVEEDGDEELSEAVEELEDGEKLAEGQTTD